MDMSMEAIGHEDGEPAVSSSEDDLPKNRFELELEFLQSLASPAYVHHLATSGILQSPSFIAFLRYLQYWKRPEYAKYISYPHCFFFLDLLIHNEPFRREMANVGFRNFVHEQQFYSWQYRSARLYGNGLATTPETSDTTEPSDTDPSISNSTVPTI
uniref:Mediator of RNA polymerase II transcription subunit 31 n=1 Tax=Attheya septentrionalis TaxID=420275 RepID=A0A7S2XM67_9STRA|mmetsp:Transcript_18547/g.33589  ORF Transcript_18547/g.33589 Transcript_18547/m.33589 type:complete len:157 (+) Transcript_18547:172-642(+)